MTRSPFGAIVALTLACAFAAMWPFRGDWAQSIANTTMQRPLAHAKSWRFVRGDDLSAGVASHVDLIVIADTLANGNDGVSDINLDRLKSRSGGGAHLVLAHLAIAETSAEHATWDDAWRFDVPAWLHKSACTSTASFDVNFWSEDWKKIIFSAPGSILDRVIAAGFDGVHLGSIGRWQAFAQQHPSSRQDMIAFVTELAATARAKKQGFLIVADDAGTLLSDINFRDLIDGASTQGLMYRMDGSGQRRRFAEIEAAYQQLRLMQKDGKPVFAVEYLSKNLHVGRAAHDLRRRGLIPAFAVPGTSGDCLTAD